MKLEHRFSMALIKINEARHVVLTAVIMLLSTACLFAQAKFEPPAGKVLLVIGQDMDAVGVPHEWIVNEGIHEDAYWAEHVEEYVKWYAMPWSDPRENYPSCPDINSEAVEQVTD